MMYTMTENNLTTLLLLFCFLNNCCSVSILVDKILKIDRFEGLCPGQENLAMTFHNLSFVHVKRMIIIGGTLIVRHNLDHEIEQVLDLTRCRNRETLDSCEKYNNMRFNKCCDLLKADGQFWSPFVDSFKPTIRCPVKAGHYHLNNGTFDANLALFPIDGWYWKANIKSYDIVTKEQLLCMRVEAEVQVIRKNRD